MKRTSLVVVVLVFAVRGEAARGRQCTWDQWGQSAAHDGQTCSAGQPANRKLARLIYDPFADQEIAETFGLLAHYQVPLSDDDDNVFMMAKTGTYRNGPDIAG